MIAALDATPLTLTSGGLARYVAELSLALAREFPCDKFVLLSDRKFALPAGSPGNLLAGPGPAQARRWWLRGIRSALLATGAQIFHGTNFEVPYIGGTPSILTIHDLSPWRDPAWHSGANRVRRRTPWLVRLRRARMILTMSEAIRGEAIAHFGLRPEQIRTIPLAASNIFRPVEGGARPLRPYFLFIGTLEPRKNLAALAEAWRQTQAETGADLWIAGRTRSDFVPIPPADGIHYLGEVADECLPGLFSGALAFVYPTFYEGFGLPVLEAMQCGCPVITSRDAAVTEVSAGAALHAGCVRELAAAMRSVAQDAGRRREMRDAGLTRSQSFSWARTARETHALYREVAPGAAD